MSKDDQPDGRVQDPQIAGIRCHDRLFAVAGTDHDVGVGDITVPLAARSLPAFVASTRSRATTS
jgi:hypothetical protein